MMLLLPGYSQAHRVSCVLAAPVAGHQLHTFITKSLMMGERVGERDKLSPKFLGSSSWSNNLINMTQINKKKITKFNDIHMYGNPAYLRKSESPHV